MKKLFAGLIASFLLSAGLVAVTSSAPSQARCPYTNCVNTSIKIGAPARTVRNRTVTIGVRVIPSRGNARPRGVLRIGIRGPGVNRNLVFPNYNGQVIVLRQKFPRVGRYRIGSTFNAPSSSIYRDSRAAKIVRVRARR